ncbi:small integral membrane protein 14 [Leptinotarsa decemlineata]|uniref:small integral membrane protein 14 n=1 Tax=Leptinotarsa decemlineata TaxID=7539 RepID=UPI000C252AC8|nr:small integral membrane protein 14 [Leptinotarsa decemlineata]
MSEEGGGFDPCECVWNPEMAMRRLLNVIRNSQSYCTDNECFTDDPDAPQQTNPDGILLMSIFFVAALFLYYLRPRRQEVDGPSKPFSGENNPHGAPPSPPPATN